MPHRKVAPRSRRRTARPAGSHPPPSGGGPTRTAAQSPAPGGRTTQKPPHPPAASNRRHTRPRDTVRNEPLRTPPQNTSRTPPNPLITSAGSEYVSKMLKTSGRSATCYRKNRYFCFRTRFPRFAEAERGLKGNPVRIRNYPRSCKFQRKPRTLLCHCRPQTGRRAGRNESEDLPQSAHSELSGRKAEERKPAGPVHPGPFSPHPTPGFPRAETADD